MRLLILDDGSGRLDGIHEACKKHELEIVNIGGSQLPAFDSYDGVLLTGQYRESTSTEVSWPDSLSTSIQEAGVPVLGIGRGFELVCVAYGIDLATEGEHGTGADRLLPTADGAKLFQGSDPIRVNETYRWCVDELPKGWAVLGKTDSGIEAMRHKTKPVYGLQLYPEDFAYASDAKLVYENILAAFGRV
jgi:GMP synthase-like glutamine amidotransferase